MRKIFKDYNLGRLSSVLTLKETEEERNDADKEEEWVRVSDSDEIQKLVTERNLNHFNQASKTPIGDPQTMQIFGWDSSSHTCSQIMKGIAPENISERLSDSVTAAMFTHFKQAAPTMEAELTFQEFQQGFAIWRELTTTSPSKQHLGHYRSLFAPDGQVDEENLGNQILYIHFQVTMAATATDVSLKRWQNCISCHIKKDKGSPKLHRLCIIHIYKADFNLVLKLLWSR